MNNHFKFLYRYLFLSVTVLIAVSCQKDDEVKPANSPSTEINNWIFDVMDQIYLWTDQIPDNPDKSLDPTDFFNSLLFSGDRFSVIYPDYQDLKNQLEGVTLEAGYEFQLLRTQDNAIIMEVLYVKPDSPAETAGLKRGDRITKINDTAISFSNYQSIVGQVYTNHKVTYQRYDTGLNQYADKGSLDLNAVVIEENPNFLDTVYTIGPDKIGYYVYNFFSDGPSSTYDIEMDDIFTKFKNEGIQNLVLDLRYNSGGSVTSAINLASLTGPNVGPDKVFYQSQYNDFLQDYFTSRPEGVTNYFTDEQANIGNLLGSNLYIITGSRTASASELIINGLDPYMNVTIIGDTTIGKNVASTLVEDTENPDNNYGMLPIIARLQNSQGYSGYEEGFTPLGENLINEYAYPLKQLGDTNEVLLARALQLIAGGTTGGRLSAREKGVDLQPVMSSLDVKVRSNRMIIDR